MSTADLVPMFPDFWQTVLIGSVLWALIIGYTAWALLFGDVVAQALVAAFWVVLVANLRLMAVS